MTALEFTKRTLKYYQEIFKEPVWDATEAGYRQGVLDTLKYLVENLQELELIHASYPSPELREKMNKNK